MTKFCYLFNNFTSYHLHDFLLKLSIAMAIIFIMYIKFGAASFLRFFKSVHTVNLA
jgi:hypothetical protein